MLTPAAPQAAFAFDAPVPVNQADFTTPANVAGLPAVVFPAGMEGDLPLSVQAIGWTEGAALATARRLAAPVATPPDYRS